MIPIHSSLRKLTTIDPTIKQPERHKANPFEPAVSVKGRTPKERWPKQPVRFQCISDYLSAKALSEATVRIQPFRSGLQQRFLSDSLVVDKQWQKNLLPLWIEMKTLIKNLANSVILIGWVARAQAWGCNSEVPHGIEEREPGQTSRLVGSLFQPYDQ